MILADFDLSVSTYIQNSIISRINSNEKDVKVDKYFKVCFKKAKKYGKILTAPLIQRFSH